MKYILVEVDLPKIGTRRFPFIFSNHMVHAEMREAALFAIAKSIAVPTEMRVISAGEVSSLHIEGCHGESTSIGVKSRGENDDCEISTHDYNHGLPL
jgi:hypothetical protein